MQDFICKEAKDIINPLWVCVMPDIPIFEKNANLTEDEKVLLITD